MKTFMLATAMIVSATMALADPAEGIWKTKQDDNGNYGHVKITMCGSNLCGKLVKSFDSTGKEMKSKNVGRRIIWDMVPYGDGKYDDGTVWSPDRDATYDSEMQLTGDKLAIKGCMIGICRDGGTWTRVK